MIDYTAWNKFNAGKTPGTTPLPEDIDKYLKHEGNNLIVDVGTGWGRVASWLYLKGYRIIGTDINKNEIAKAKIDIKKILIPGREKDVFFQVDDSSKHINIADNFADGVTVNGVLLAMLTELSRNSFIAEIYRILKPGAILYLAEFAQSKEVDNYRKHALITGEFGTIAAFKPDLKISFKDKTDDEIISLGDPRNIDYFAHAYTEKELRDLLKSFKILEFKKMKFTTRSGRITDGFVIYAKK